MLSTLVPNGAGGEAIQFHHPDRLGTRLVTYPQTGTSFEQAGLPFGTAIDAESSGSTNKRFTSYDRSVSTGLDYAVNRHYDSQQGRFTQVDPAGMRATSLSSPQTLNLYSYCANDPINRTDPAGLGLISFFKKVLRGIAKILTNKWVLLIVGIALGVLSGFAFYLAFSYATVNTTFLAYGIALAAMSALLIVGAYHQGFLNAVKTIGGIVSSVQGVLGAIGGVINGGMLGTPPWNPSAGSGVGPVSNFQCQGRGCRRRVTGRGTRRLPIGAIVIDVATGKVIAELTQKQADKYNEERKAYYACLGREWKIYNQNLEKIEGEAHESYEKNGLPWWLEIATNMGGGSSAADRLLESMPAIFSYNQMMEEIARRTKQAAKLRDQAIQNNCKEPSLP